MSILSKWVVLATLLGVGCQEKTLCDLDLLRLGLANSQALDDPAAAARGAAQALRNSCNAEQVPPALWAWVGAAADPSQLRPAEAQASWAEVCAELPLDQALATPGYGFRGEVYRRCGLSLGSSEAFQLASGAPFLAQALHHWLGSQEVEPALASELALAIQGGPAFEGMGTLFAEMQTLDPSAPILSAAPDVVLTPSQTALPEGQVQRIAISPELPASTLMTLLREHVAPGSTLQWVGVVQEGRYATRLGSMPVRLSGLGQPRPRRRVVAYGGGAEGYDLVIDGRALPPVEDCDPAGPTLCKLDLPPLLRLLRKHGDDADGFELSVDARVAGEVLSLLGGLAEAHPTLAVPYGVASCQAPPPGMACVPGGPTLVRDAEGRHEVVLSTYYIDVHEVSNAEWRSCQAGRVCANPPPGPIRFRGDGLPVRVPPDRAQSGSGGDKPVGSWLAAMKYCAWAGKRLPTAWEWDKAAYGPAGQAHPWGAGPASCAQANSAACGKAPREVSSLPAQRYGLKGMEGNVWEWTATWAPRSLERCGEDCVGADPQGPCQGVYPCPGHGKKQIRGGGYLHPASDLQRAVPEAPPFGVGLRCVVSSPTLSRWPPQVIDQPWPEPAPLAPPSTAQLALFHGVKDDPIDDKPFCDGAIGHSGLDCRDTQSYIKPNEGRAHVLRRYIRNIGGAYVGVASDQNYSYAAIARSEWLWLMDYDPAVVRLHKMLEPLILDAADPDAFVAEFAADSAERATALVRSYYANDTDGDKIVAMYTRFRASLDKHYRRGLATGTADDAYGWLRNPEHYAWIRLLHQQHRIDAVGGDLLAAGGALSQIGAAARAMGVPMRIYYTSNAPDAWGGALTPAHKANVLSLPMDERSVVLQVLGFGSSMGQTGYWHYNVYDGRLFQQRMALPSMDFHWKLVTDRIATDDGDVTINGLPSAP